MADFHIVIELTNGPCDGARYGSHSDDQWAVVQVRDIYAGTDHGQVSRGFCQRSQYG